MNLDRSLKSLKGPKAPSTLIPGVMARVRAEAAQPWWRRAWWTWPMPARLGLVAGLALVAVGAGWGGQSVDLPSFGRMQEWSEAGRTLWRVGTRLADASWRPLAWMGLWSYAVSLGFGTTLWKIAKHG